MSYWGYHLMLDCSKCLPLAIRNKDTIERFAKQLVRDIDMVAYGEPQIVKFGTGNKAGYTLVQLIETSNICAHFVEETNDMYLDVFSCKEFNKYTVHSLVGQYFGPVVTRSNFLLRDANLLKNEPYLDIPRMQ